MEISVDVLSYATLLRMHGRDFQRTHLLSLAGVFAPAKNPSPRLPASITRYLEDYHGIQRIDLHLDNDPAGRAAVQNIMDLLGMTYDLHNHIPPDGCKDTNEYLCGRLDLEHHPRKKYFRAQR